MKRRNFLGSSVGFGCSLLAGSFRSGHAQAAPSERIRLGVIGLGSRGFNLIDDFLREPTAEIVAICDVDRFHYRDRPWGEGKAFGHEPARKYITEHAARKKKSGIHSGPDVYKDYREICNRSDIDAVVIATPDHWHALCTLQALKNGKDVYCEKPVTHLFREGQQVYREVKKQKAVFQTGSQQRSMREFQMAVNLVRNGHLGKIRKFEVGLPPGYEKPMGSTAIETPRKDLDYNFWCGPSEVLPLMQARFHRWWRGHRAYGGGVLMDWIGHHNDIAHWALEVDLSGPTSVNAVNWIYPETKIYNTPFQYEIRTEYPGGITGSISSRNRQGLKIIGEDGWVYVRRGRIDASQPQWFKKDFKTGSRDVPPSPGHARNFLECIKSRQACVAPAENAHRSITPGHLGYVSWQLGRALEWDPVKEVVVGDSQANQILNKVEYREGWDAS